MVTIMVTQTTKKKNWIREYHQELYEYVVEYCNDKIEYIMFDIEIPWKKIKDQCYRKTDETDETCGEPHHGLAQLVRYGASDIYMGAKAICDLHVKHM